MVILVSINHVIYDFQERNVMLSLFLVKCLVKINASVIRIHALHDIL